MKRVIRNIFLLIQWRKIKQVLLMKSKQRCKGLNRKNLKKVNQNHRINQLCLLKILGRIKWKNKKGNHIKGLLSRKLKKLLKKEKVWKKRKKKMQDWMIIKRRINLKKRNSNQMKIVFIKIMMRFDKLKIKKNTNFYL